MTFSAGQRRLLSSTNGAIERVLFALPRYVFQHASHLAIYEDLLRQLPAATRLVFVVHASVRGRLEALLGGLGATARSQIIDVDDAIQFSTWVEDNFVVGEDGDLAQPSSLKRVDDARLTELVFGDTAHRLRRTGLYFEGGNILVGDDFWLLGGDHPLHALHLRQFELDGDEAPLDAIRRAYAAGLDGTRRLHLVRTRLPVPLQLEVPFERAGEPWLEVRYAGNLAETVQPIFPLDKFVSLAGRSTVLVGDPRAAAELLGESLPAHGMAAIFDDIAAQLAADGLDVIRNPLPLVHHDDPEDRKRKWYFASSNNALVQIDGGRREVWLPSYGHGAWSRLAITDAANRRTWEALGFEVRMLADCHPLAYQLGSIHCIKKVLARTAHPSGDSQSAPSRPRSSA